MKLSYKRLFLGLFFLFFLIFFFVLVRISTFSDYDSRDLSYWDYTDEGLIQGAERIEYSGNSGECWLLLHAYITSPQEYDELAPRLYNERNATVVAPRLLGHGERASNILNLTYGDWYSQVEEEFILLSEDEICEEIYVVGSSLGGSLSTRLAEQYNFSGLILVNSFLDFPYYQRILVKTVGGVLGGYNKLKLAVINDPEGVLDIITYHTMPYAPLSSLLSEAELNKENLSQVTEPVLLVHSHQDIVASYKGAETIYNSISSEEKRLIWFDRSGHILLKDYDKNEIMDLVVSFPEMIS
jgi:carboxylesterase